LALFGSVLALLALAKHGDQRLPGSLVLVPAAKEFIGKVRKHSRAHPVCPRPSAHLITSFCDQLDHMDPVAQNPSISAAIDRCCIRDQPRGLVSVVGRTSGEKQREAAVPTECELDRGGAAGIYFQHMLI
jgi:hypothetical protein